LTLAVRPDAPRLGGLLPVELRRSLRSPCRHGSGLVPGQAHTSDYRWGSRRRCSEDSFVHPVGQL